MGDRGSEGRSSTPPTAAADEPPRPPIPELAFPTSFEVPFAAEHVAPGALLVADIDGDGSAELVVGSTDGRLRAFKGLARGAPSLWRVAHGLGTVTAVCALGAGGGGGGGSGGGAGLLVLGAEGELHVFDAPALAAAGARAAEGEAVEGGGGGGGAADAEGGRREGRGGGGGATASGGGVAVAEMVPTLTACVPSNATAACALAAAVAGAPQRVLVAAEECVHLFELPAREGCPLLRLRTFVFEHAVASLVALDGGRLLVAGLADGAVAVARVGRVEGGGVGGVGEDAWSGEEVRCASQRLGTGGVGSATVAAPPTTATAGADGERALFGVATRSGLVCVARVGEGGGAEVVGQVQLPSVSAHAGWLDVGGGPALAVCSTGGDTVLCRFGSGSSGGGAQCVRFRFCPPRTQRAAAVRAFCAAELGAAAGAPCLVFLTEQGATGFRELLHEAGHSAERGARTAAELLPEAARRTLGALPAAVRRCPRLRAALAAAAGGEGGGARGRKGAGAGGGRRQRLLSRATWLRACAASPVLHERLRALRDRLAAELDQAAPAPAPAGQAAGGGGGGRGGGGTGT